MKSSPSSSCSSSSSSSNADERKFRGRGRERERGAAAQFCHLLSFLGIAFATSIGAQETERQYLSGHGKDDAVPWKFFCTGGEQSRYWTNIPVPSNWELHGFGTLNYKKDSTNPPPERGLYEHDFTVPQGWRSGRVFLVFDGVMTDTSVKVNGESAGPVHQGGFYQFKFDVTKLLRDGTNRLEVAVDKHSANESVNRAERLADFWVFGGIYRPVYLEAVPSQFIERVAIDAKADGAFRMHVFADGITNGDVFEAQIMTSDGKPVGKTFNASAAVDAELRTQIDSPLQWTAETPNLYTVEVRLKRGDQTLHRIHQRFGFRTMEVRDGDGLYVNGRRVILKGANRHSFWPDSGRCLSEKIHQLDIFLMKDMNMNAVRMSHYPPDAQFLDLCDEQGLYVLDELTGWHNKYDDEVGRKLVREMVVRDVNHPSILFWDNGNEGGFNTNLDALFGELDPQQRRVLHPWAPFSGINTAHYLAYTNAKIACTGSAMFYHHGDESVDTNDLKKYIYMPTEFMHGLYDGGAGAGLDDYWKMMSASPVLGGGFIWAFTDDGVKRPDNGQIDTAGNQAPDGIVGPYRQREGSFYAIKEIWSPIQITRSNDIFTVENHYSFTDARNCRFSWSALQFRGVRDSGSGLSEQPEANTIEVPSIPPGGKGTFKLSVPGIGSQSDALAIRVEDPQGRELWTWSWPTGRAGEFTTLMNAPAPQKASASETSETITLNAGDLAVKISKENGRLMEVKRDSQTFSLSSGPKLSFDDAKLTSIRAEQDGPDYIVSARFSGNLKSVLWRLNGNGWLQCSYKFTASGEHDSFGVTFDYPEEYVTSKRWLGDGPYRVWKNRLRGVVFGMWENLYNDTITGYRDWDYPEFKGCFANVRWLQLGTTEGPITVVPEKVPFVQVLTPSQPPDNLVAKTKVNLPHAGLAFLNGIPPVGTKFKDSKAGGPQGNPNIASGEYSGMVSFYFGELPEK